MMRHVGKELHGFWDDGFVVQERWDDGQQWGTYPNIELCKDHPNENILGSC